MARQEHMGLRYGLAGGEQFDPVELRLPPLPDRDDARGQESLRDDAEDVDRQPANLELGIEARLSGDMTDQRADRSARDSIGEPWIAGKTGGVEAGAVADEIMGNGDRVGAHRALPNLGRAGIQHI